MTTWGREKKNTSLCMLFKNRLCTEPITNWHGRTASMSSKAQSSYYPHHKKKHERFFVDVRTLVKQDLLLQWKKITWQNDGRMKFVGSFHCICSTHQHLFNVYVPHINNVFFLFITIYIILFIENFTVVQNANAFFLFHISQRFQTRSYVVENEQNFQKNEALWRVK